MKNVVIIIVVVMSVLLAAAAVGMTIYYFVSSAHKITKYVKTDKTRCIGGPSWPKHLLGDWDLGAGKNTHGHCVYIPNDISVESAKEKAAEKCDSLEECKGINLFNYTKKEICFRTLATEQNENSIATCYQKPKIDNCINKVYSHIDKQWAFSTDDKNKFGDCEGIDKTYNYETREQFMSKYPRKIIS